MTKDRERSLPCKQKNAIFCEINLKEGHTMTIKCFLARVPEKCWNSKPVNLRMAEFYRPLVGIAVPLSSPLLNGDFVINKAPKALNP